MLEAKSEKFWQLIDKNAEVKQVCHGFAFYRGTRFQPSRISCCSVIFRTASHEAASAESVTTFRENSNKANGLTFDHQGRLITAEGGGRVTRTEKNGSITILAQEGLSPTTSSNRYRRQRLFQRFAQSRVYIKSHGSAVGWVAPRPKGEVRVVAETPAPNGVRAIAESAATLRRRCEDET